MPEAEKIDDKTLAVFKKKGYKIANPLGSGSYGMVYKVEITKTGQFAACKVMNLEKVTENIRNKFLPREMAAMIESKHKNVVQLFDIFKSNRRLYIFMEFASNGDIMGYLKKHGPIALTKAHFWFKGTSEGLNYLHNTLFIAHRDIKLDNILLDENNIPKISDFGFAKKSYNEEKDTVILSDTICGTEPFKSPQILKRVRYDPFKADMWAMGTALFAILNDRYPFHFDDLERQLQEIEDPEHLKKRYIKEFCKHVRHLIRKLFEIEESDRYSIKDVLEHKWIREKLKCCEKSISQSE